MVPIDRATISLVWSDGGYPASGIYRDYHRHTVHHHNPWSNDGSAYDHARALALAAEHAQDFVARTIARLSQAATGLPGGGLVVCALDTELFGHWWYEGVAWLKAVVQECTRQGLKLMRLDDALQLHEPLTDQGTARAEYCQASTWGKDGDLSTWSAPAVADMAFAARSAELAVLSAGSQAGTAAVRELLGVQASDWAFMVSRGLAVPYARERFEGHLQALQRSLSAGPSASSAGLRNLAIQADPGVLLAP